MKKMIENIKKNGSDNKPLKNSLWFGCANCQINAFIW